jgi:uncharacterized membrane protein
MIGLAAVYLLTGLVFVAIAILSAGDLANPRRWANASFWGLYAVSFLFGSYLGDFGNGMLVLVMVMIAGFAGLGLGRPATTSVEERRALARKFGDSLFLAATAIPVITMLGSFALKSLPVFDPAQTTIDGVAVQRFGLTTPILAGEPGPIITRRDFSPTGCVTRNCPFVCGDVYGSLLMPSDWVSTPLSEKRRMEMTLIIWVR